VVKEGQIMFVHLDFADSYIKQHTAELMADAQRVRLADEAMGPGRPMRIRIADWLYAVAEWIEGNPRQPTVRAQA
jgi:hypothetical protein